MRKGKKIDERQERIWESADLVKGVSALLQRIVQLQSLHFPPPHVHRRFDPRAPVGFNLRDLRRLRGRKRMKESENERERETQNTRT